jgi:hypothetical protein
MKQPGFFEGVALAFGFSLAGGLAYGALNLLFPADFALRLVIAGLGLAYLVYLLRRSRERVGRLTTLALWIVVAAGAGLWPLSLPLYVLAHVGMLWLVRSLYFHNGFTAALADLMLNGFALAGAVWAAGRTGSLFLALWCFFLAQALFAAIPELLPNPRAQAGPDAENRFQHAHRAAEAALRRLSSMP